MTNVSNNACGSKMAANGIRPLLSLLENKAAQLQQSADNHPRVYHLQIAGRALELHFLNTAINALYLASFKYVLRDTLTEPADIFYIWSDNLDHYIPEEMSTGSRRWLYQGDEATLTISSEFGYLSARNHETNLTYLCMSNNDTYAQLFTSHPFVNEMNWWARAHRLFLVHSAAVGIDGKGVLISAFGGNGKTTLALACLLQGMDYIADDYLLLDQAKSHLAYPIYSTAYMLPDSLNLLPQLKKSALGSNREKQNKTLIDLSSYLMQFTPSLDIKAIVFPVVSDAPAPNIEKIPSAQPMLQMVYSTVIQNREEKNPSYVRELFAYVKGLPTYKINLSGNVFENAKLIEKLVNELK